MELELVKLIHELVGLDQPQSMSYSGRARSFTGLMHVSIDLMRVDIAERFTFGIDCKRNTDAQAARERRKGTRPNINTRAS